MKRTGKDGRRTAAESSEEKEEKKEEMGYIGSSALAIGAFAAVVFAIVIAYHDLALERLRKYCTPTPQEAEWAAAYVEIAEDDVDILDYGEEQLGVILS